MTERFKYVTPETGRIILTNRTLRWSTPPTLNDPFDMQFALQLRIDRAAARAAAIEKGWQHHSGELHDLPLNELGVVMRLARQAGLRMTREKFEQEFGVGLDASLDVMQNKMAEFSEEVRAHFRNDKILCLSEVPDSLLMWAYYASNHTGIVLCFRDDTHDNPFSMARPVRYVDQVPSLFDDDKLSDMLAGYGGLDHKRITEQVVWTKSAHWAHEREWRIYTGAGRTADTYEDVLFGAEELAGVIFGARAGEEYREEIAALVAKNYPATRVFQARLNPNKYALLIEPRA